MTATTSRSTEARNDATLDLDLWSSQRAIAAILAQDAKAVEAAEAATDALAALVDATLPRIESGGRVHVFGAGASGRLALLDATETVPTFGAPPGLLVPHFPGGVDAILDPSIDFEDADRLGESDAADVTGADVVLGVTASGTTSYVAGALRAARRAGAVTALVTSNPLAPLATLADHLIVADTGAEAITGSTRLKAGTATKVLLNAFSTTLMVRSGRTYSNLMTNLVVTNSKLRDRAIAVIEMATGCDAARAAGLLELADGSVPLAIVHARSGRTIGECRAALNESAGIRSALDRLERTG
ncbi:N-acetylmuramic acid 6-phosphate etherase [Agromyces silvae]|uniref:N-acetylmuramic acid 6-phosphate etherase n=1 Tax=Agromyces silvae TaxID=3388266 RepID=UPI00280BC267|nr:N-acetylmuramic acid 6-phosphate etherase [Agromyces protaetiae]